MGTDGELNWDFESSTVSEGYWLPIPEKIRDKISRDVPADGKDPVTNWIYDTETGYAFLSNKPLDNDRFFHVKLESFTLNNGTRVQIPTPKYLNGFDGNRLLKGVEPGDTIYFYVDNRLQQRVHNSVLVLTQQQFKDLLGEKFSGIILTAIDISTDDSEDPVRRYIEEGQDFTEGAGTANAEVGSSKTDLGIDSIEEIENLLRDNIPVPN